MGVPYPMNGHAVVGWLECAKRFVAKYTKNKKLNQTQSLKPKLFEYEPARGQIDYGQICGTIHSLTRQKLKNWTHP